MHFRVAPIHVPRKSRPGNRVVGTGNRVFSTAIIVALAGALAMLVQTTAAAQAPRKAAPPREPQTATTTFGVPGLDNPVEILVDSWGVPHIYAKSQYDAFFAQGFNAARDRLWQIDLWRRKGLGLLAEVFGPSAVPRDRAARLFLFRGNVGRDLRPDASARSGPSAPTDASSRAGASAPTDASATTTGELYREWLAYESDTKRIAESFVAGINAYVRLVEQNPDLLPVEFRLLDYTPSLWAAEDLVRIRAHGEWGNLRSEVRRAQVGCIAGLQADLVRRSLEPPQPPKLPEGIDLCDVTDEVLTSYRLATSDIAFTAPAATDTRARAPRVNVVSVEPSDVGGDSERGSAIAIAARSSTSNKPLVAIDLADRTVHALPASRYLVHVSAPGLNAIGAVDPFLPGIAAGHNDRVAWGPVRYPLDQEDLLVAELASGGIRVGDRIEPITTIEEIIPVRGAEPETVTLRFTRHGPIVHHDTARNKAWALRAGWLDVGMAPSMASIGLMRAQNWDAFVAATNRWGGAPAGHVYADVDSAIAWKASGLAPIRRNHDGLLPVPLNGQYEWTGFADNDRLSVELNPARGWIVQAGQPPSGATRLAYPLPAEWSPRWRAERIVELLDRIEKKSPQDLFAIQSDVLSVPARRLVLLLKDTQTPDLKVSEAITLLRNWDFRVTPDSPAAALFEVWYSRHLAPAMIGLRSPQGVSRLIDVADSTSLLGLLEQPVTRIQRDSIFVGTLRQAIAEMEQRQGANWLRWNWGALHRIEFTHPLAALSPSQGPPPLPLRLPLLQPRPRGGGAFTLASAPYRAANLQHSGGASTRMVFDLGNWDNALASSAPGQSGDPRSRHYADLVDPWSKDSAHPLLFSRGAIEKATVLKIQLNPLP